MGREIRRVPLDWEHPKDKNGGYIPLFDKDIETAKSNYNPDDYDGEPFSEEGYRERQWTEEEAVGCQLYEDTSEGTPLSPVFENQDDLIKNLTSLGDYCGNVWSKESVQLLLKHGWAPTFVAATGRLFSPHEQGEIG